jgi:hypothetical protein
MSEVTRGYVYRVGLALVLLAVAYGLVADQQQIAGWVALIAALTGNSLASRNTEGFLGKDS